MIHNHDPEIRLQFAQERADWLTDEMRRARGLTPDEVGYPRWGKLAAGLFGRVAHSRRERSRGVPAYDV